MLYSDTSIALDFSDAKQSALFFDYVIPADKATILEMFTREDHEPYPQDISRIDFLIKHLLPDDYTPEIFHQTIGDALVRQAKMENTFEFIGGEIDEFDLRRDWIESIEPIWKHYIEAIAGFDLPVVYGPFDFLSLDTRPENQGNPEIVLTNLKLVNTKKTSWQQVLEFRKDAEAIKSLRRLRLFLFDNYRDKPSAYVEDHILGLIDDYEAVIRKWGFDTISGSITNILNSKSFLATAGGAFATGIFGTPTMLETTLLAGASIELGQFSLTLQRAIRDHRFSLNQHPMAYIFQARTKLGE